MSASFPRGPQRPARSSASAVAATWAALAWLAPTATGQLATPGYAVMTEPMAANVKLVTETAAGQWTFDGRSVWLTDPGTGAVSQRLRLRQAGFGSFLTPLDATTVLFGDDSGNAWLLHDTGAPPNGPVANIAFGYDAAPFDTSRVLVSARTGGWSAVVNDLVLLDLTTGSQQTVATIPGASGPLAVGPDRHVYYATADILFPQPPGSVSILRFDRGALTTAITSHTVLGPGNATVVATGLDAAVSIALDDDGDLFFSDFVNATVGELRGATGASPVLQPTLLDHSGSTLSPGALQCLPGLRSLGGAFEPWQPPGRQLAVHVTDFAGIVERHRVVPRRPLLTTTTSTPVPAGPFSLTVNGPENGLAAVLLAAGGATGELWVTLPPLPTPVLLDAVTLSSPLLLPTLLDASGTATVGMANPGFANPLPLTAQVLCLSMPRVSSSTPRRLLLGP